MDKVPMFCAIDDCFRTVQNHWENVKKFSSCPLRPKNLVFQGVFAFLANCFGFRAYPCMSMPAGAAPLEIVVEFAALAPKNISASRRVSRQSRPQTLVFLGEKACFVVEVQDSN